MDYNNIEFAKACENGDIKHAKTLLKNNPTINISANAEHAFKYSCRNGHLHVAQWLLSVKSDINISYFTEYAFRKACERGHLHVAQWLLSVKPDINKKEHQHKDKISINCKMLRLG